MSGRDGFDWGRRKHGQHTEPTFGSSHRGFSALPRSPAEALEPARATHMPRSGRRSRKPLHPIFAFLSGGLTLLLVGFIAVGGVIYFAKFQYDRAGPLDHSTILVIPKGESINDIAARLEREGVIRDRRIFVGAVRYFQFKSPDRMKSGLKAGEYEIKKSASMRVVLDTLTQGRAILHKVSLPEGLTSGQMVQRLLAHPQLTGEISEIPPEGSLLPDTYKFTRGMSRADLIARMKSEQAKFIDRIWKTRAPDLPIKSPEEAIILASIVEKETGRADERGLVAGVFINRLNRGMRLQSDPTIIYGIVGTKGSLGRPIYRSEIQKKTPYNTYQIDGLPPTAIANPGRAALEAVLNPEKTNYIYFVADGTGGHAFAESLNQHRKNVQNWRKIEKQIRADQARQKSEKATQDPQLLPQDTQPGQTNTDSNDNSQSSTIIPGLNIAGGVAGNVPLQVPNGQQNGLVVSNQNLAAVETRSGQANGNSQSQDDRLTTAANSRSTQAVDIPLPIRRPN